MSNRPCQQGRYRGAPLLLLFGTASGSIKTAFESSFRGALKAALKSYKSAILTKCSVIDSSLEKKEEEVSLLEGP